MGTRLGWHIVLLFCALSTGVAQAHQSGGRLRARLAEALDAAAKGQCSDTVLGPLVLDACEQQIARMQPALGRLGTIRDLRFRGVEQLPTGVEAEVYRVVFTNGEMVWTVAAGPNGKLVVLFSPGVG